MDIIEFDDEYYNDYLSKKEEKINANLSKQISLNSRSFSNWMSIVASSDILDDESKKVI